MEYLGTTLVVIYVDDLIVTGDSDVDIDDVKLLLKHKFEMKDLGELRYFLGIEVIRSHGGICLLQMWYGLDMLSKYGMTSYKPISIPLEQNVKISARKGEILEDVIVYRCIVGTLIYMTITRLDLSYAMGLCESVYESIEEATFECC